MDELIRRALLGSREAQKQCTEAGIVLPCWRCGGESEIQELHTGGKPIYAVTCKKTYCGAYGCACSTQQKAIEYWNTRPAPPIGRCKDCVWSREPTKEDYTEIGRDVLAYKDSLVCDFCEDAKWKDDFCSYFKKRKEKNNENN